MYLSRGPKQAGISALLIVLVIALWVLFAPLQMGGATSFVVINGKSMEPLYHTGDLVVVRRTGSYAIGDIVAYRAFEDRALVIHRIIGREGDRYVFKGDNNDWTDSLKPLQSDLIGKAWIHIPGLGQVVRWLRNPLPFSILAGLFGFALLSVTFQESEPPGRKRPGRRSLRGLLRPSAWFLPRQDKESPMRSSPSASPTRPEKGTGRSGFTRVWSSFLDASIFLLGFVALAAVLLGLFAFTRPLWRQTSGTLEYQHSGAYSYTAEVPEDIYDTTALETGQPVFVKLTCTIDLEFAYSLRGDLLGDVSGSHHLTARLSEAKTGWSRSFDLEPRRAFRGNHFTSDVSLDLCQLEEMARAMEEQTGLQAFYYTLTIEPQVAVTGTIAGQDLQSEFNPPLTFQADPTAFYFPRQENGTDPLNPAEAVQVSVPQMEPNTLVIFNRSFEVEVLRRTAAVGFGVSIFLLLAVYGVTWWLGRRGLTDALQLKYASMLVDADGFEDKSGKAVIRVRSMEDLARLADREHALILRVQGKRGQACLVQAAQAIYRYDLEDGGSGQETGRPAGGGGKRPVRRRKAGGNNEE